MKQLEAERHAKEALLAERREFNERIDALMAERREFIERIEALEAKITELSSK